MFIKDYFKKVNWKIRIKNPFVWGPLLITMVTTIFSASNLTLSLDTSWHDVGVAILGVFTKPYVLISVVSAFIGIINDPTTHGFKDSDIVLEYNEPKKREVIIQEVPV